MEQAIGMKYLTKLIVKRITIEGEHTYLMTMRPPTSSSPATLDLHPILNVPHQASHLLSIPVPTIKWVLPYQYMFQMKGLRLVSFECEEHLIVFKDAGHADKFLHIIHELDKGIAIRNYEVMNVKQYQDWWVTGTITNGEYLLYLNFVANRSFNDLTQYPVFPWVIADYKNSHIDFEKGGPFVYRDLGKPIGALN